MDAEQQSKQHERRKAVTEALVEVLQDGEVFVVAKAEGKLLAVVPAGPANTTPALSLREPELYGRLMKIESRLAGPPGAWLGVVLIAGSVLLCLALVADAGVPLVPASLSDGLRNGWAYAGIVTLGVFAHWSLKAILRRLTWLGARSDLARALRSVGLTTDELLAELRSDDALGTLKTFIGRSAGNDRD